MRCDASIDSLVELSVLPTKIGNTEHDEENYQECKQTSIFGFRLDTIFNKSQGVLPPIDPSISLNQVDPRHSSTRAKNKAIGKYWNARGLQRAKVGEWEKAVLHWESALEARLQAFGENHGEVANTLNNMGIALGLLQRYKYAMEQLNRALEIRTEQHGKQHLVIAATLHNIANIYQQMKDYNAALKCFEDAKCIQESLLGHDAVPVGRAICVIGHLKYEHCYFEGALQAYEHAKKIFEQAGFNEGDHEYEDLLECISDSKKAMTPGE